MSIICPVIEPLGDCAFMARFADNVDTPAHVHGFCAAVRDLPGVVDVVPAFSRVCVHYDPLALLAQGIDPLPWMQAFADLPYSPQLSSRVTQHVIPVCHDLAFAPDLSALTTALALDLAALLDLHHGAEYTVGMIGFAPGFPYMTGLPPRLQLPRRATPRTRVAPGSVAIAEQMCGIYPRALPGGWHIIGRTPLTLFDAAQPKPCLMATGDTVRFVPITREQFEAWPC